MLDLARRLNEERPNLVFHLNQQPDLGLFPTDHFDFVYSRIVLQHMAPEYAMRYIEEFVRVVRPGGLVAFQIPSRPGDDGAAVSDLLRPSGVFRAEVVVPAPLPELVAGGTHRIDVHVANASSTTWAGVDGSGPDPDLSVGNHWLDLGDNVVQMDDGRAALPVRLAPGDARRGAVGRPRTRCSPARTCSRSTWWRSTSPGSATREASRARSPSRSSLRSPRPHGSASVPSGERGVTGERPRRRCHAVESKPMKPRFEMHGTAPSEILAAVASAGGSVSAVQVDGSRRGDWPSYFYFVTK